MKSFAFIQARLGSRRLPRKVFREIEGQPMLDMLIERVRAAPGVGAVVISTSPAAEDDALELFGKERGIPVSRHDVDDIVGRMYHAAQRLGGKDKPEYLIRFWGDSPLMCPDMIEEALMRMDAEGWDFFATGHPRLTYPAGLDFEAFSLGLIERMEKECRDPFFREFPYEYIKAHPEIGVGGVPWHEDFHELELSVDYEEDLAVVSRLVADLRGTPGFWTRQGILAYCAKHRALFDKNGRLERHGDFKKKKEARDKEREAK